MDFAHFAFDPEQDRLGEGPQSEVFRAVDQRLGRTVALKILRPHVELDPAAAQRFEREAKHTSSLLHPNIATIYEYGLERTTSYIAMEYLEGRTLDRIIKDNPLSYEEGVRIGLQVAAALALVHERGLVHRDLKPANIMVLGDGSVKLLDFGICRSTDESNITQSGMLVGTVLYMAPEQVRGETVTAATDVFALGSVLYHALSGSLPFPGRSFPEVCMAILDGSPLKPSEQRPGFPADLEEFVMRCLAREPQNRYANGAIASNALQVVSEENRLTLQVHQGATLRGRVLLTPITTREGGEHAVAVAAGLRRDLQSELERSTQLDVALLADEDADVVEKESFLMRGRLALRDDGGCLDYSIERADGSALSDTTQLWADRIDVRDEDEWGLQAKLVGSVARTLRRRLAEYSVRPVDTSRRDPEKAIAFCFHAHGVLHRGTTKHLLSAISSFRRALEADPTCALAHAGLSECLARKFLYWDGDASFLEQAREEARRALALNADLAEAHTSLGFAHYMNGEHADAQREYRMAIQADKDEWLAHRLLGALLARNGNFEGASPLLRRAIALRPDHIATYDHLYNVLCRLDSFDEAQEVADRGIRTARQYLARVADDQDARMHLALLLARIGWRDDARAQVVEGLTRAPKDGFTAFHAACVQCVLGEVAAGLHHLEEAQARGFYIQCELIGNSDLDVLRGRPEFQRLVS